MVVILKIRNPSKDEILVLPIILFVVTNEKRESYASKSSVKHQFNLSVHSNCLCLKALCSVLQGS